MRITRTGEESLFDFMEAPNEPRYKPGDTIYKVTLDVIKTYLTRDTFSLGVDVYGEKTKAGHELWRYHLDDVEGGLHSVFGEYEMDGIWFDDLSKAEERATRNKTIIERERLVIRSGALRIHDEIAYLHEYPQGRELYTALARIGKVGVYVKHQASYPFLDLYDTEKEAAKSYKKALQEVSKDSPRKAEFHIEDLYKAKDERWSSYEYAEHWGDWSCLDEREPTPKQKKKDRGRER